MTNEERLDRLELALVELAIDVAPHTMGSRAIHHDAIGELISEHEAAAAGANES